MDWGIVIPIVVVVVLIALVAVYLWASYTSLVALKGRVDEAWADIATQLHRRAELVPTILDAVTGYATHEKGVVQSVNRAREETLAAATPGEATVAENHMQQALRSVFTVAEAYPRLQASPSFLQLQSELADTEDRIQASRRFYNGGVREFNTKLEVFPNSMFARRLGFTRREFFEVADSASIAQPPRIQF
ncbi:MAG TPA: LemA family protein [Amnibacterium sp.]|jgi:LemA protein|nr:LemA family protein [Amnibacterium sp.]